MAPHQVPKNRFRRIRACQDKHRCNLQNVTGCPSKIQQYIKSRTRHLVETSTSPPTCYSVFGTSQGTAPREGRIFRPEKEQSFSPFPPGSFPQRTSRDISQGTKHKEATSRSRHMDTQQSVAAAAAAVQSRGMVAAAANHPVSVSLSLAPRGARELVRATNRVRFSC